MQAAVNVSLASAPCGALPKEPALHLTDRPVPVPACHAAPPVRIPPYAALPATARAAVLYTHATTAKTTADRSFSDRWLARDKALHVTYSFLWTLSSQYVLVEKTALSHDDAIPYALLSGFAVGVAKETYDRYRGPTGRFSWRDMVANSVGLTLAAGVMLL